MLSHKDQQTMLKVKSLLWHVAYFLKKEDIKLLEEFHMLCRKECSMEDAKYTTEH